MGSVLLSIKQLKKVFPVQRGIFGKAIANLQALADISMQIDQGEIVGLVGESGCGKSTLGRCIVALEKPSAGEVLWEGASPFEMNPAEKKKNRKNYQMVFQNPFASLNPRQSIKNLLLEPLEVHGLFEPRKQISWVIETLVRVGLSKEDLDKYPHEFSGGQRQRIGLARALACQPKFIVLDEPVSSLDISVQASILNLLSDLNREHGISFLFISHDLQVVAYLSRRIQVMYLGRIVEQGDTEKILTRPRHPYTKTLLDASEYKETMLKGEPPNPVSLSTGCSFHPRCPYTENRCFQELQSLQNSESGCLVACWKWERLIEGRSINSN